MRAPYVRGDVACASISPPRPVFSCPPDRLPGLVRYLTSDLGGHEFRAEIWGEGYAQLHPCAALQLAVLGRHIEEQLVSRELLLKRGLRAQFLLCEGSGLTGHYSTIGCMGQIYVTL